MSQKGVLLIGFEPGEAGRIALSLGVAGHRAMPARSAGEVSDLLNSARGDLAVVNLSGQFARVFGALEAVQSVGAGRCPLLGMGPVARCSDIAPTLRGLGLQGLVPSTASPQEIVFRVNQVVYADRRTGSRIRPRVPVNLPVSFDTAEGPIDGRILNLSETGLFVSTEALLPVDRSVTVRFALDAGAAPITATGRVAWANASGEGQRYFKGMGLQFLQMRLAAREELHAFLAQALAALDAGIHLNGDRAPGVAAPAAGLGFTH